MKRLALFSMLLSLSLFTVGCAPPKKADEPAKDAPATDTDHEHAEGEEHAEGDMPAEGEAAPAAEGEAAPAAAEGDTPAE